MSYALDWMYAHAWVTIGFSGQVVFMSRMIVQWIAAERKRDAVIPVAFWWLSLAGGLISLAYAVHKLDPVFMVAQGLGTLVYLRNLMLIRQHAAAEAPAPAPARGAIPAPKGFRIDAGGRSANRDGTAY